MANFIEVLKRVLKPYYFYVLVVIVLIIFVAVGKYSYDKFYVKKQEDKKTKLSDVANANKNKIQVVIYFFHVDWCPHCKNAMKDWQNFRSDYDNKVIGEYVINCIDMNCTEETSDIAGVINEYKIDSYPTIKMVKEGQKIEFDSKISYNTLEQFVNTILK